VGPYRRNAVEMKNLSENLKRRYHFGRLRCRCEDNIKNDIKEIDCEDVD
jgi:hypothetical protein